MLPRKIELAEPLEHGETRIITSDDGTEEEVYVSKAGNIVTPPSERCKNQDYSRRELCWEYYVKTWRSGNPDGKNSALKAGFSENTAINIGNQRWFKEKRNRLRRSTMMTKAERNLNRILSMKYSKMKLLENGNEEEVVDKDILRVVADISKTIVTTLGKDEGYSTKTEVTGKMDGEIKINSISYADPVQIENTVVENAIEQIEEKIIKDVIIKEDEKI